ncbi:MAG: universal stress protein [Bacteroidota bacterium]
MFRNILIPVDFSQQSLQAFKIACKFGERGKSKLTLINIIDIAGYPCSPVDDMNNSILDNLKQFAKEVDYAYPENIQYEVISGMPGYTISETANAGDYDLVIMGTHSKQSNVKKLIGSVALKVLESSNIPVLVVPDNIHDLDVSKIAYATDFKKIKHHSTLDCLRELALDYDAELHLVNVTENPDDVDDLEEEAHVLHEIFDDVNHAFFFSEDNDIKHGLRTYIKKNDINVLAMMPRKHNFIQDLFHKSATEEVALDLDVPLFSFHEK